jgi:hypothetical protein
VDGWRDYRTTTHRDGRQKKIESIAPSKPCLDGVEWKPRKEMRRYGEKKAKG